jgi:hypothetical protein
LPSGDIKAYHNLESREELEKVIDLYYENLREHRVAPTSPFELYPMKVATKVSDTTENHVRNFLDCVKSRNKPNADIEDGHRSTTLAHLANIALATRSRIEWDGEREAITNNKEANALLDYTYRAPWRLPG